MNTLTICLPYYINPKMLAQQYVSLAMLRPVLKRHLKLIVVDDGSPKFPATFPIPDIGIPVSIYKMLVDIRWNQHACRNLAVARSETPWILLTDMDHLVPDATLQRLVFKSLDENTAYKFSRVSAPRFGWDKPHANSWCMSKKLYDKIGGYDERLAGFYGTDKDFRRRVTRLAPTTLLKEVLVRVPRTVTPDASTTTYTRRDRGDRSSIESILADRPQNADWRPLRLSFPWRMLLPD